MSHEPVTIHPRLTINVYDPCSLYDAAIKAYMKGGSSREDAESFLGTPPEPNLVHCLVEIWAEHAPACAGYEFVDFN